MRTVYCWVVLGNVLVITPPTGMAVIVAGVAAPLLNVAPDEYW